MREDPLLSVGGQPSRRKDVVPRAFCLVSRFSLTETAIHQFLRTTYHSFLSYTADERYTVDNIRIE